VSADRSNGAGLRGVESSVEDRVLRVQTTFHLLDEAQGQGVAAKLIDRAHELANSPECECDLDVSVEWVKSEDLAADPEGMAATDRRSAGEQPAAR
jgi:GNAT superfamily N-acetyltransferase